MTRRPWKSPDDVRNVVVRVLVTAAERESLRERAAADGVPVAEYVRRRVLRVGPVSE